MCGVKYYKFIHDKEAFGELLTMELKYRISLWNYFHYANPGSLEKVVGDIASRGYGVELWPSWEIEEDLFNEIYRERLRALLKGLPSSWHSGSVNTLEGHRRQIDTASYVGSDVIVVHARNLLVAGENADFDFAQKVLDYAREKNVTITLENGPLPTLKRAVDQLDDLKICLDTGHAYYYAFSMKAYVDALKDRLYHLHIQDYLEKSSSSFLDHYIPGTGLIPKEDWLYLLRALEEIDFKGAAVLEIRPRVPLQTAMETKRFFSALLEECNNNLD